MKFLIFALLCVSGQETLFDEKAENELLLDKILQLQEPTDQEMGKAGKFELPALNIRSDLVTACGFSAGSSFAMELLVIFSEVFKGAGLLNGGPWGPVKNQAQSNSAYLKFVYKTIEEMAGAGYLEPLSNLKDAPVYVWGGALDKTVPKDSALLQNLFFTHYGSTTKYETDPNSGHTYKPSAPVDILKHLLANLKGEGFSRTVKEGSSEWQTEGHFGYFDQYALAKESGSDILMEQLYQMGFVYYPNKCVAKGAKKCLFQLVLHGEGMSANEMAQQWGPVAAANNMVMVFPQAKVDWDSHNGFKGRGDVLVRFMQQIVQTVAKPLDSDRYNY